MFIYLLLFLLNMKITFSTIIIQGAGIYDVQSDDIAIIFYVTVENSYDHEVHASVSNIMCVETAPYGEENHDITLIGGDMGYLKSKSVTNLTLIYPNLYLLNRAGKCLIGVHYEIEEITEEIRQEIHYQTPRYFKEDKNADSSKTSHELTCNSVDQDARDSCNPVDCVIKYSSTRSYFNKELKTCQQVPSCSLNCIYNPKSNTCRKDREAVCRKDLEMIEDGYIEKSTTNTNFVNFNCHNGEMSGGNCECTEGWITSTCNEGLYHPTLSVYHMCNVGISSWGESNKRKLIMTILALTILALAIAAKMFLAVCLLNWCCNFIKSKKNSQDEDDFCEFESCPYLNVNCGDEECDPEKNGELRSSRSVRVSFSDIGAMTESSEENDDRNIGVGSSASVVSKCQCGK